MKFSATDIAALLKATGQEILISGTPAFGKFRAAGKVVDQFSGQVVTSAPTLVISDSDAALVVVDSTIININSTDYQATESLPEGNGISLLVLTKDFA